MKTFEEDILKKIDPSFALQDITKLFGEASYRVYYRVRTSTGQTFILMQIPEGKQSVSEEITNYQGAKTELPFINVGNYLARHKVPVPRILAFDLPKGLLLLQDLGDTSLERLIDKADSSLKIFFYKKAIDLLLEFQSVSTKNPDAHCIAFNRSFDKTLLQWEFEHFLEYGIEDRLAISIPEKERQHILQLAIALVASITDIPYGLTHRDFQSRNLMMHGYALYLIDFQDALMGPIHYDLVALLRDSYVSINNDELHTLIHYYLQGRDAWGLPQLEANEFIRNFHRITLQRKLKDAGRFQFIHSVKGNSKFLIHVPQSLAYVKNAFENLDEYNELRALLSNYIPELK